MSWPRAHEDSLKADSYITGVKRRAAQTVGSVSKSSKMAGDGESKARGESEDESLDHRGGEREASEVEQPTTGRSRIPIIMTTPT